MKQNYDSARVALLVARVLRLLRAHIEAQSHAHAGLGARALGRRLSWHGWSDAVRKNMDVEKAGVETVHSYCV